ncbi:MAG: RluA family pseudouridine synthase [Candidatus Gracilibacteria bacterium]
MKTFTITEAEHDLRIDKFLRRYFASLPLSTVYKLLRKKTIKVNNKKADEKYLLQKGDTVEVFLSEESLGKIETESKERRERNLAIVKPTFEVLFEDESILVVNKPGDIAVHSGTSVGINTLINQILTYLHYKGEGFKPALAHRLDMQTSGIILVGKTREALLSLNAQIKDREVQKYYLALAQGMLEKKEGTIKVALKRNYHSEKKFKVTKAEEGEDSQEAVTKYKIEKEWKNKFTLLRLQLITGRTHQIRAHLATIGHPIIGDSSYGNFNSNHEIQRETGLKRQFLHSTEMIFTHPITKKKMDIVCPLPKDLEKVLAWLNEKFAD